MTRATRGGNPTHSVRDRIHLSAYGDFHAQTAGFFDVLAAGSAYDHVAGIGVSIAAEQKPTGGLSLIGLHEVLPGAGSAIGPNQTCVCTACGLLNVCRPARC